MEGEDREIDLKHYVDPDSEQYQAMVKRIGEKLNFTSLHYARLDDMIKAVGLSEDKLCTYCWSGKE